MAVRLLVYSVLLFCAMMTFLIVKEPYTLRTVDQDGHTIPDIELFKAQNFQIKTGGIESVVYADKVNRFKEFDQLEAVQAGHITKDGLRGELRSDEAIVQNKVIHFMTHSHYARSDGIALDGEDIFYDLKNETLSSEKPFIFLQKQSRTNGLSFVYQMKEGTIAATNIHSFIQQQAGKHR